MDAEVNTKGRVIYKGPKGGFYVLDAKGKKVYKFTRAVPKVLSPAPVPKVLTPKPKTPSPNKNTKGRVIYKGPKGGFYVLDAKGKKVYKFTRAVPVPNKALSPKALSPKAPPRPGVRKSPLLRLLQAVRRRREPVTKLKAPTIETRTFKRFTTIRAGFSKSERGRKDVTLTIKVPEEIDKIKNGTVLAVRKDFLPTQKWLDDQAKYIQSLNEYDYLTAMAYTVRSHEWIGPWLRGSKMSYYFSFPSGHTYPLYPQIMKLVKEKYSNEPWAKGLNYNSYIYSMRGKVPDKVVDEAFDMYAKDLYRIVRGAPPVPQTMYVFRGTLHNIFKGKIGQRHILDDFASTAYVPQRNYAPNNYLRIKLVKGTRALLLQGLNQWNRFGEFEVLINRKSMYKITKRNLKRPVVNAPNAKTVTKKYITDVTVF